MAFTRWWRTALAVSAVGLGLLAALPRNESGPHGQDSRPSRRGRLAKVGQAGDESVEGPIAAEQYAEARSAPGIVLPGAYGAAFAALSGLPVSGPSWTEVTIRPYDWDNSPLRL